MGLQNYLSDKVGERVGPGHKVWPQTEEKWAYPEKGNLHMKERDYGSYIEDIIEHMNYADEFIIYMA